MKTNIAIVLRVLAYAANRHWSVNASDKVDQCGGSGWVKQSLQMVEQLLVEERDPSETDRV